MKKEKPTEVGKSVDEIHAEFLKRGYTDEEIEVSLSKLEQYGLISKEGSNGSKC